ncbi:hypothetical protein LEP1GSC008_3830 [Leptospira kirschneri serovar Bulgarica str. Nikolaevo]|uniref:Uncharacterized protein n=1 Tax=Leptospira kirschneri serovar Bulgarica str. Nikolaevo TaxID=1240687 RepID=M6EYP2_9LEPT|nr:hypothetical protein LEP1GSC008_3830 [Leptospira kirschneri serovar Bulgarica str. Nikolaevo]
MIQYKLNSNNQAIGIKIQNWSVPKFPAKSVMDGKFCKLT